MESSTHVAWSILPEKYRQRHHKRVQTVSPGLAIGGHAVSRGDRAERFQTD
jgi:hypothetical protein